MKKTIWFPEGIEDECFSLFRGYASTFPEGDYQWSTDDTALEEFLKDLALPEGILDAGCGPGEYLANALAKHLKPKGKVMGLDFCPEMILEATRRFPSLNVEFIVGDLRELHIPESSFGLILCTNNTLGNIPGQCSQSSHDLRVKIIQDLVTLLKPNGAFFCSVYNYEKLILDQPYSSDRWLDMDYSNIGTGDLFLWRKGDDGSLSRVYSHWFKPEELRGLLRVAGLSGIRINEEGLHLRAIGIKEQGG